MLVLTLIRLIEKQHSNITQTTFKYTDKRFNRLVSMSSSFPKLEMTHILRGINFCKLTQAKYHGRTNFRKIETKIIVTMIFLQRIIIFNQFSGTISRHYLVRLGESWSKY